jgi:uncharacterized protein (DUF111 family)
VQAEPINAAALTILSASFGPIPLMKIEQVGHGAGTSAHGKLNMLRRLIGQSSIIKKIT